MSSSTTVRRITIYYLYTKGGVNSDIVNNLACEQEVFDLLLDASGKFLKMIHVENRAMITYFREQQKLEYKKKIEKNGETSNVKEIKARPFANMSTQLKVDLDDVRILYPSMDAQNRLTATSA